MDFDLPSVCEFLSNPTRVQIVRELAAGIPLPVAELAHRVGTGSSHISRQLAFLRSAGVTEMVFGRLHRLTPAFQPAPGAQTLDLRQVVLVLRPEGSGVRGEG